MSAVPLPPRGHVLLRRPAGRRGDHRPDGLDAVARLRELVDGELAPRLRRRPVRAVRPPRFLIPKFADRVVRLPLRARADVAVRPARR